MNDNGGCDQRCVNYGGRAVCQCYAGWSLAADGRKCEGRIIRIIVNRLPFCPSMRIHRLVVENWPSRIHQKLWQGVVDVTNG